MGLFGMFGGGRQSIAEQRRLNARQLVDVARQIERLHGNVRDIERKEPYEKNNSKRRKMQLEKMRLEQQLSQLERRHEDLATRNRG